MPEVVQLRGDVIESVHPFSAVVVGDGGALDLAGDDRVTPWRSAAKPLQLATSLELLGDPELAASDLAIGAASHGGEPRHVALVSTLLARFGLGQEALRCGAHAPSHASSAESLFAAGKRPSAIHNNCSGKHAFMAAATRARGWNPDYRPAEHPLQRANATRVTDLTGEVPALAVDGCGVPTFAISVGGIARAWQHIAVAMTGAGDPRLGRIGLAMAAHPELTSGAGRLDLDVVSQASERMAVKIGAFGVFCVALPERRLGLALKVHSGSTEALPAAVAWWLARVAPGAHRAPDDWAALGVRNVVGATVGAWRVR